MRSRCSRPKAASREPAPRHNPLPDGGDAMTTFRDLHGPGQLLLLANAWDAGSARVIEARGARAIATTSAGLAWSRGHPDGDRLPAAVLAAALREIARVISVPLSVDVEGGYSSDPLAVGEPGRGVLEAGAVRIHLEAGAVGINLEDGSAPPELLCRKIEAARTAAAKAGVDLFVNARCDVYLRRLVPAEGAVAAALERGRRYHAAGCDGLFVPGVHEPAAIRAIARGLPELPLNVLWLAGLPPLAELPALGVRRLSAGSAL